MDPVTLVVSAVALGAAAGLKDTASAVVKDAYEALKSLLEQRNVDVSAVERKPDSTAKWSSLYENLAEVGIDDDVLAAARRVADEVQAHDHHAGFALGIDIGRVKAEFLKVRRVEADGTAVRIGDSAFVGGIDIEDIRAGQRKDPDRP